MAVIGRIWKIKFFLLYLQKNLMPTPTYGDDKLCHDVKMEMFILFWKTYLKKTIEGIAISKSVSEEQKQKIELKIEKELGFVVEMDFNFKNCSEGEKKL